MLDTGSVAFHEAVRRFVRFVIVGGGCYGAGLGLLYVGTEHLRLHYLVSLALALIVTNTIGWAVNRAWTFAATERRSFSEYVRYSSVTLLNSAVTLLTMWGLVSGFGFNYLISSACVALIMAVINVCLHSRWSFGSV